MQENTRASRALRRLKPSRRALLVGSVIVTGVIGHGVVTGTQDGASAREVNLGAHAAGASTLTFLGLPPAFSESDIAAFGDIVRFVEAAASPTATAQPAPTSTPAPLPTQPPPAPRVVEAPQPTATAVPPTPVPPTPTPVASGLDTSPMDAYSAALVAATNARRASVGLPPLRVNGLLVGIARLRADEMAQYDYFAHESPITGDTAFSLMDAYGVPFDWAGENLAKNNYPESEIVQVADEALWNSQGHRDNITNPHYTDIGIALAIDENGMKYFAIIFTGPL